jgi:short-subunit dehydrogenase
MKNLKNQVIWITGASAGIGEALAISLGQAGARLVLSARRQTELERVKQLTGLPDTEVLVIPLDLAAPSDFGEKVNRVMAHFGRIDIVIHNAGISQRSFARNTQLAVDRRLMEVNYLGTVALTKAILPIMLRQQAGHLAVVTSLVGLFGSPMRTSYAASKHALHGFFDSLRAELWRDHIDVSLICPGYIRTDVSVNALNENGEKYNRMDENQALGMDPHQCAALILQGLVKRKEEILIGGREVWGVYLKRFLPRLFSRMLRKLEVK